MIYYSNDKVWCIYKTKDETTKSKTKLKRLYKWEMRFVNLLAKETNSYVTRLNFELVMSSLTKLNKDRLIWHHDNISKFNKINFIVFDKLKNLSKHLRENFKLYWFSNIHFIIDEFIQRFMKRSNITINIFFKSMCNVFVYQKALRSSLITIVNVIRAIKQWKSFD